MSIPFKTHWIVHLYTRITEKIWPGESLVAVAQYRFFPFRTLEASAAGLG